MFGRLVVACCLTASTLATTIHPVVAATRFLDPIFTVDVQKDVVYGHAVNVDGVEVTLTLDVYTPHGDASTKRPVFIWAHGGFFFVGSKESETAWARRMAARGYVSASINYRLSSTPVFAPVDTERERAEIDDAREDMQTAVRWFRANASALHIDPERVAVGGSSAGAVTALGVAVNNDDPQVAEHQGYSSAVCTAVSFSGANDPVAVDAGDAGAIFHHGSVDTVVPYDMAVQTSAAMEANGLPVQFFTYDGEGHSLSDTSDALAIPRTIQWLYDRVATVPYPCSAAVASRPRLAAQSITPIAGRTGSSAVVSIVAVQNDSPGYVQSLGCADVPGGSSNLNLDAPGQIRSVLAVVRFASDGTSCLFNQQRTHLVADLQGYFTPGSFDDVADQRILDTRLGARPADGAQIEIHGRADSSGVVSIVATDTTGPGYVQALACGDAPGAASNLNIDRAGQTRAALAYVRFDGSGRACVYTQRAAHVVVDLQGYLAPGAFDDIVDTRILDTRLAGIPQPGTSLTINGRPDSTAVVSLVATENAAAGFVQVGVCGATPGSSSNLNTDSPGQTVATAAFVHFDGAGTACLYTQSATHLVVDVQGYMAPAAFDDIADVRLLDTRI